MSNADFYRRLTGILITVDWIKAESARVDVARPESTARLVELGRRLAREHRELERLAREVRS